MSYHTYSFENLEVYQLARGLRVYIRTLTKDYPREERYELTNQLRRAADRISTNIAEGSGRSSNFDQAHFTNISFASALEVIDHLNASLDLAYISKETYNLTRIRMDEVINKLNSLYKFQIRNVGTLKNKVKGG
jgi:four helix bundle protein